MSSKRRIRRNSCEGKIRYYNFEEADQAAAKLRAQIGEDYHAYPCKFCRGKQKKAYHVGRRPKEQREFVDGM